MTIPLPPPPETTEPSDDSRSNSAQACFDYALTGIIETNADGRILRANPAACSISARSPRQLLGVLLNDLLDPSAPSKMRRKQHMARVKEQGINRAELRLDGGNIIEIASIDVGNGTTLHMFDDVTEQRRMMRELEEAKHVAEKANAAKSHFLANMSHEIRTPLNGVIGLAQLALMTSLTQQQEDYIYKIQHSSYVLLAMLNELLDFSKIEAERVEFEKIPFSLDVVLEELALVAAQTASGKNLELVFRIDADVPRQLIGDNLRVGQVLHNLLSNAIKFTDSGEIVLSVTTDSHDETGTCVKFSVKDTGIGLTTSELAGLFKPFSQAAVSTTRRFGGTGLGLAITKMLTEGMGGQIEVRSTPGTGSEFSLHIPFPTPLSSQAQTEADDSKDLAASRPTPTRRALIAGAHPRTCDAVQQMLEYEAYLAETHCSFEQLINALDTCATPPTEDDVLVLDYNAEPNSLKQLARISKSFSRFVLLVDHATSTAIGPLLATPGMELLQKPVTPLSLRKILDKLHAAPMDAPIATPRPALAAPREFAGARILIAEDNQINREVIDGLLSHAGIIVFVAEDGQQALQMHALHQPELILIDVQMPKLDGLAATRALRADGARLPIIGLSAGVSKAEQEACSQAGMNDFIGKPIDADELWGVLTRWLPARSPGTEAKAQANTTQDKPAAKHALAEQFPGIDLIEALPRFLNKPEILCRILGLFIKQNHSSITQLNAQYAQQAWPDMQRLTHSIKGAAANIGAAGLLVTTQALEAELKAGNSGNILALIATIDQQLHELAEYRLDWQSC